MRFVHVSVAVMLVISAPVFAQVDLPFEMYGEKVEVDWSGIDDMDEIWGNPLQHTVSSDGNIYAMFNETKLLAGRYPDYTMTEVIDMNDLTYEFPIDDHAYNLTIHPDNSHIVYTTKIFDPARGGSYQADTTFADDGSVISISKHTSNGLPIIAMTDIATGETEVLVEGGNIAQFSPDGQIMAYMVEYGPDESQWALYDMNTGESTLLKELLSVDSFGFFDGILSFIFGSDGTSIFYVKRQLDSECMLFKIDMDDDSVSQVTGFDKTPDGRYNNVDIEAVSSDGEWMALSAFVQHGGPYLLLYELSSGRVFSLLTGEEFSDDLRELDEYDQHIVGTYLDSDDDASLRSEYLRQGDKILYTINGVEYDYETFHLVSPSFIGWCPDGETMVILGNYAGSSSELYFKTFDPMFYKSQPTVVADAAPAVFPTVENYPNPFNPKTTISFTLPEAGFTELSVYNLTGQKVRELVAAELAPGTHDVVWDGRDMNGMPVSSGVFFSRLNAGDTVVTDRMSLVK